MKLLFCVWYLLLAEAGDLDLTVFSAIGDEQGKVDGEEMKDAENQPDLGAEYVEEVIK